MEQMANNIMAVDRLTEDLRQKYLADLAGYLVANPDQLMQLDIAIQRVQHAQEPDQPDNEPELEENPADEQHDPMVEAGLELAVEQEEGGEYFEFDEPRMERPTCGTCGKQFSSKGNLNFHIRAVHLGHRVPCRLCERKFKSRSLADEHEAAHHRGERFLCSECEKTFVSRSGRDSHLLYKHNREPVKCTECDYQGRTAGQILNHVKVEHLRVAAVDCPTCFKTFKSKYEMRRHQRIHLGQKFSCDLCEKIYSSKSEVQRHKRVLHRGDRFECEADGNRYTSKASLEHHRRRVHSNIY